MRDKGTSFHLAEATPDPVLLTDPERVIQALLTNDAGTADLLGSALTTVALITTLDVVGRKEELGLGAVTAGAKLPIRPPCYNARGRAMSGCLHRLDAHSGSSGRARQRGYTATYGRTRGELPDTAAATAELPPVILGASDFWFYFEFKTVNGDDSHNVTSSDRRPTIGPRTPQ